MLRLRELQRSDLAEINSWRNDPQLISLLGAPFRYINAEVDEKWFDSYLANRSSTVRCAIVNSKSDKILGLVSLTDIDYLNQSASIHIMIGCADEQGKGMGTYAMSTMVNHAFKNLNLHRVQADVLADNERSIHVLEKIGFVKEGIKRQAVFKNGIFKDMVCLSILREDS